MKIHIIGGSGTGKSYLAEKLAEKYNIAHYDLDDLQWDNHAGTYGVKMPVEKKNALLQDILSKNDWIMEGVYYKWVLQCFEDADRIYVLEIPRYLYRFRIIKRFIKRKLYLEKGKKETLKSLHDLLKWTDKFQTVNMSEIKKILDQYNNKVIFLKSREDIRRIIEL